MSCKTVQEALSLSAIRRFSIAEVISVPVVEGIV